MPRRWRFLPSPTAVRRLSVERVSRVTAVRKNGHDLPSRVEGFAPGKASMGGKHWLPAGRGRGGQYIVCVREVMAAKILEGMIDEDELAQVSYLSPYEMQSLRSVAARELPSSIAWPV